MGKIVLSTSTSLDGVVQDPDGREGWPLGGWFDEALGDDREVWAGKFLAEAMQTDALLLGRRTDEWFGARWNPRTGAWADQLNRLPKYVVSETVEQTKWHNGTFPVVGAGLRLFGETGSRNPLRLVDARKLGERLVAVTYTSARG